MYLPVSSSRLLFATAKKLWGRGLLFMLATVLVVDFHGIHTTIRVNDGPEALMDTLCAFISKQTPSMDERCSAAYGSFLMRSHGNRWL